MSKYKYYFRKPRSEIVKDVFYWLAVAGAVSIAATSPYFGVNLLKCFKNGQKYKRKKVYDTFYMLKKRGCIETRRENNQIYISLTEKGKKDAGWLQINDLKIKKPKNWDKKWRLVIFDIAQLKNFYREVFRGKLKELGFYKIQQSVWMHPFDCRDEVELLKAFLGLTNEEVRFIETSSIGDDAAFKKIFNL